MPLWNLPGINQLFATGGAHVKSALRGFVGNLTGERPHSEPASGKEEESAESFDRNNGAKDTATGRRRDESAKQTADSRKRLADDDGGDLHQSRKRPAEKRPTKRKRLAAKRPVKESVTTANGGKATMPLSSNGVNRCVPLIPTPSTCSR